MYKNLYRKKLEATKRRSIVYNYTNGGLTAKLDAVSFELFKEAFDQFICTKKEEKLLSYKCDKSKDKKGNIVQYTYNVAMSRGNSYTVNLYVTQCSILVNGKMMDHFVNEHLAMISDIMENITINGVHIDRDEMNKLLASKLQEAINILNRKMPEENQPVQQMKQEVVICDKCTRYCRTRAFKCDTCHWRHYRCEKLTEEQIDNLDDYNEYYCRDCAAKGHVCVLKNIQIPAITSAEALLHEENEIRKQTCMACNKSILNDVHVCDSCHADFHDSCLILDEGICFGCKGTDEILKYDVTIEPKRQGAITEEKESHVYCNIDPEDDMENTTPFKLVESRTAYTESEDIQPRIVEKIHTESAGMEVDEKRVQPLIDEANIKTVEMTSKDVSVMAGIGSTDQPAIPPTKYPLNKGINNETTNEVKLKDIRLAENKLKKKEEQLRVKEQLLNDKSKEQTKLIDKINKLETRNMELERTIKTLLNKIEVMEINMKCDSHMKENGSSRTKTHINGISENDRLLKGVQDRVTNFILQKIDREIQILTESAIDDKQRTQGSNDYIVQQKESPTYIAPTDHKNVVDSTCSRLINEHQPVNQTESLIENGFYNRHMHQYVGGDIHNTSGACASDKPDKVNEHPEKLMQNTTTRGNIKSGDCVNSGTQIGDGYQQLDRHVVDSTHSMLTNEHQPVIQTESLTENQLYKRHMHQYVGGDIHNTSGACALETPDNINEQPVKQMQYTTGRRNIRHGDYVTSGTQRGDGYQQKERHIGIPRLPGSDERNY